MYYILTWLVNIGKALLSFNWLEVFTGEQGTYNRPVEPPVPPPMPVPPMPAPIPPHPPELYDLKGHSPDWCGGNIVDRRAMYKLAGEVCAREGLSEALTEDLLATVWGESGWNQWCVNKKTLDFGLCQFSIKYYIKSSHMTPQDALEQPERCLTIMARAFKAGRQTDWVAYQYRAPNIGRIP